MIIDKNVEQDEIESKYIWNICKSNTITIKRFNLDDFATDYSKELNDFLDIRYWMALPNNQFFGMASSHFLQYLFISDENFNIRPIERSLYQKPASYKGCFATCFYDDSIFVLEDGKDINCFKRYIISQNKWIKLAPFDEPFQPPTSCIGFNQKIIIAVNVPGVWIYDIFLDSYSEHSIDKNVEKMMFKSKGKLYLLSSSIFYTDGVEIYSTDNPLSEWTLVCQYNKSLVFWSGYFYVRYNESIYHLNEKAIKSRRRFSQQTKQRWKRRRKAIQSYF